jgi:hypothetical protein
MCTRRIPRTKQQQVPEEQDDHPFLHSQNSILPSGQPVQV